MKRILTSMLCFVAGLASAPTEADTFLLEAATDLRILSIYENSNFEKDFISIYTAAGNEQRSLLWFDIGSLSIPTGLQVKSAVLSLVASRGFGSSQSLPMEAYRLTKPWAGDGATWNARLAGTAWTNAGGDYVGRSGAKDSNPYATSTQNPADGETLSWDIAELVQEWRDNIAPNYGVLLRSYFGNGLTFPSIETAQTPSVRPKLTLLTEPGLPRLRAVLAAPGEVAISWRGENIGTLEESSSPNGPNWTTTPGTPTVAAGTTEMRVSTAQAPKFFRLR
jgi:hypothetical protein